MQTIRLVGSSQRDYAHELIDTAPHGAVVTIKEQTRSVAQNSRLWAMLSDVSMSCPEGRMMTADLWKVAFMAALGHEMQFAHGIEGGPPIPMGFRSSKLTVAQMSDLMEFISAYGARHGVMWREVEKGGWND